MKYRRYLPAAVMAASLAMGSGTAVSAYDPQLVFVDVSASSTLPTSAYGDYKAWNLMDCKDATAWVEGVSGDGIGEMITFTLPENAVITGFMIKTGFCIDEDLFWKNSAPTKISYYEGGVMQTIDLSSSAQSYAEACAGYYLEIPPIAPGDSISFVIQEVRNGWKYTDTCISEFHLLGYVGQLSTASSAPNTDDGQAPGSVSESSAVNTAEAASSSATDEQRGMMTGFANWVYKKHFQHKLVSGSVTGSELTADEKAMLTYWYQYHYHNQDSRIAGEGQYNYATENAMREIQGELFDDADDADFEAFRSQYVQGTDRGMLTMNGGGDFGDAGAFNLGQATSITEQDGQIILEGPVDVYGGGRADYRACFRAEPSGYMGNHAFQSLEVTVY
mgnify:FL=1